MTYREGNGKANVLKMWVNILKRHNYDPAKHL